MGDERRQHDRLTRPLEASWHGASGASPCRIGDLGLGGCFVQSLAIPVKSESTVVTIAMGDRTLTLTGTVVYTEPGMGFALQFTQMPESNLGQLAALLESRNSGPRGA